MVQVASANRDENQVTELKKADYLPYLFNLVMPKMFFKSPNRIVMARLYPDVHKHDQQSAEYFEGFQAPCFDLPASLFPDNAPIDKIVFMPTVMLPMGFEAGGVFGPGVLPRDCYPVDLIRTEHEGPMPPLFVGLRSMNISLASMIDSFLDMYDNPEGEDAFVYEMHATDHHYDDDITEELMLRPDFTLSVAYSLPATMRLPSPYPYPCVQAQDNIYTPDLSKVLMLMPHQLNITVSILSTVNNPHVPSVAFATMSDEEECPTFDLPTDVFPICEGVNRPIFLPKRFMPKGFEACCVFKPGSLSELWFIKRIGRFGTPQQQHNCTITPPLFVGKYSRDGECTDMIEEIRMNFDKKARESAKSIASLTLETLGGLSRHITSTKGFLVMESDKPTPPAGAYSVESYEEASEDGCIAKVTKECASKITDTRDDGINTADYQSQFPELEPEPEPEPEDEGEDVANKKKCLSCFKIDSDIDVMSHAIAELTVAELSMLGEENPVPGVDTELALDQLREVLENRGEIRSNTDDLMRDHIYRMERDLMLALRQPIRKCCECTVNF